MTTCFELQGTYEAPSPLTFTNFWKKKHALYLSDMLLVTMAHGASPSPNNSIILA